MQPMHLISGKQAICLCCSKSVGLQNTEDHTWRIPALSSTLPLIFFLHSAGAVLPVLKQLYMVVHNSGYGRRQDGKKAQPRVFRAKLDSGDVIVGKPGR